MTTDLPLGTREDSPISRCRLTGGTGKPGSAAAAWGRLQRIGGSTRNGWGACCLHGQLSHEFFPAVARDIVLSFHRLQHRFHLATDINGERTSRLEPTLGRRVGRRRYLALKLLGSSGVIGIK